MDIIIIGRVGEDGILELVSRHEEEIASEYSGRYISEGIRDLSAEFADDDCMKMLNAYGADAYVVGRQGIFGALYKMGQAAGTGMRITLMDLPISQFTIEMADRYDENPYMLSSLGCILVCAANGNSLADRLNDAGYPARIIGYTTDDNACIAVTNSGETYLSARRLKSNDTQGKDSSEY